MSARIPLEGWHNEYGEVLSPRETEALGHVSEGLGNRQIANLMGITLGTAKQHMVSVLRKLGLPNRTAAAVWYVGTHGTH